MGLRKIFFAFVCAMLAVAPSAFSAVQSSDFGVAKTGPATAANGTDVTFNVTVTPYTAVSLTITLRNLGPNAATGVALDDPVSGGWSFVSVTPGAGFSCTDPGPGATSGTVNCTAPTMASGATSTFTVVFHIPPGTPAATSLVNVLTVRATDD